MISFTLLYWLIVPVLFVFSWIFIIKFDIIEVQEEEGFLFQKVFKEIWKNEKLTILGKIAYSLFLAIIVGYILITSGLILKRLFIKG